jgi:hypothetical protein
LFNWAGSPCDLDAWHTRISIKAKDQDERTSIGR